MGPLANCLKLHFFDVVVESAGWFEGTSVSSVVGMVRGTLGLKRCCQHFTRICIAAYVVQGRVQGKVHGKMQGRGRMRLLLPLKKFQVKIVSQTSGEYSG